MAGMPNHLAENKLGLTYLAPAGYSVITTLPFLRPVST